MGAEELKRGNHKNREVRHRNSVPEKDLNDSNVNGGRNEGTRHGDRVKWRGRDGGGRKERALGSFCFLFMCALFCFFPLSLPRPF